MGLSLEQTLAFHCAPALAGLKPADLISCNPAQYPDMNAQLEELERALSPAGICFHRFSRCQRGMLLVYRQKVLDQHLEQYHVQAYLARAGYPAGDRQAILRHLEQRLADTEDFPHEIGVLLGYPPEDVEGFQRYHGKNYKLSGYWKVYGDEAWARERFARYTRCRNALCTVLRRGLSLTQLFRTA